MNKLELPPQNPWLAGQKPNADMMNEIQDSLEFLLEPPECRVFRTGTDQSITTSGAFTPVVFDYSYTDTCEALGSAMWTPANPGKVYARVPGWYEVLCQVYWTGAFTDGGRRVVKAVINDDEATNGYTGGRQDQIQVQDITSQSTECGLFMNTGDYVSLYVWHEHGSNVTVGGNSAVVTAGDFFGRQSSIHIKWVSL